MIAASWPRPEPLDERLLQVDPETGEIHDARVRDLPRLLEPGDLVVVNDAATLPASLRAADGSFELRLVASIGGERFRAVLFGAGDHRTPTEQRPDPPVVATDVLELEGGLAARIVSVDPETPRLVDIAFDRAGAPLYAAIYATARPIQYAHVPAPLSLWHVQNRFAAVPWAFELPSAGRPLTWSSLLALKRRGIGVTHVTHAAGISSTGSELLDRRLPLPERYVVGESACRAVQRAREQGGRVIAVGTTVVRALESAAIVHRGRLAPTEGETSLRIGPDHQPQVVDAVLSGMHARGTSHYALLRAFASDETLTRALEHAEREGYLEHEFGDSCLVYPRRAPASTRESRRLSA
jgi:S-adenosylmethionine:tRNA ribosyltransferase-isomerase